MKNLYDSKISKFPNATVHHFPPPPKKKTKKNNTSSQVSNFFFPKPIFPFYFCENNRNNDGMVLHKHTFVFVIDLLPLGEEESNQE